MERKHRAAAEIFREQNIMQQQAQMPELDEVALGGEYNAPTSRARYVSAEKTLAVTEPLTSEELQLEKEPIRVRETGIWLWRRVVVPPNVYVVHTRIGRKEPVTIGLGLSFRYNPFTDAYLVVPAAMQTIGIVANGISTEKQGINILAYVQWQINDFAVAYRKLDFSDSRDPLGIVNAQLREQAEAAIKDKIATMSVEEILTDKEPIIEELTTRLKTVSEGRAQGGQTVNEGLGIKIVTVQIKEARVSSQRLWEHLQAPFRYEKEMAARISQLNMQDEVHRKELETRQIAETSEAETLAAIERIKQSKQTEAVQVRLSEESVRFTREQESAREKIQLEEQTTLTRRESDQRLEAQHSRAQQEAALEQARLTAEANIRRKTLAVEEELARISEETRLAVIELQATQEALQRQTTLKTAEANLNLLVQTQTEQLDAAKQDAEIARERQEKLALLELEEASNRVKLTLLEREVEIARLQQEIRNLANERDLVSRVIAQLPELAAHMPDVHELHVLQTGGYDSLAAFLSQVKVIVESLGLSMPNGQVKSDGQ